MTLSYEDIAGRLDHQHIERAAEWAGHALDRAGVAHVVLTPNDGTRYVILVVHTPIWTEDHGDTRPREYQFATSFGPVYPWDGQTMSHDYVLSKWVEDGRLWTAVVLTEFMNALAVRLETA